MNSENALLYSLIFGICIIIVGVMIFFYCYAKFKERRLRRDEEKARYISMYSKRESGEEVLGKYYEASQKLTIPKTEREGDEVHKTDTL
uniref:ABC transporter ATP-binding protein n=1 Tax=Parastrongyloides trichosuri TaxID=131310 RepID=A0A0N4ZX64_PARTI